MPRRAFTLIELLVVIAVIALLIGLALPAIGRSLEISKLAREQAMQRTGFTALTMYANDSADLIINYGVGTRPFGGTAIGGIEFPGFGSYFNSQNRYWATGLLPAYITTREAVEDPGFWDDDNPRRDALVAARSQAMDGLFALPAAFDGQPGIDAAEYAPPRVTMAEFPSLKVVLAAGYGGGGEDAQRLAAAVGHALTAFDGSQRSMTTRATETLPCVPHPIIGHIPLRTTERGIAGRDLAQN